MDHGDDVGPEDLLALALSRPSDALTRARALLAGNPAPRAAALAHQAAGIVLRDFGDIDESLRELRAGLRAAGRAGERELEADVRAAYGVALVMAGRTRPGLAQVAIALEGAQGVAAGRIHIRRAHTLLLLGRHAAMLEDAQRATELLAGTDPVWEARAYNHRAIAHQALGSYALADADYARCEQLFAHAGQDLEYASARHDRAAAAFARGDLPGALSLLDDAQHVVDGLGVFEPDLAVTRAQVLLAAGLARDAVAAAQDGMARSDRLGTAGARRGELLHVASLAAFAAGDLETAIRHGTDAALMFRRQRRGWWAARAELGLLNCRFAAGERDPALALRAARLAGRLERQDGPDAGRAAEAHLLAGRLALAGGRNDAAAAQLRAAAAATGRDPRGRDPRGRAAGWLARAVLAEAQERPEEMLAACSRGLRTIDLHLQTLGATELRAWATAQGAELSMLALRQAVQAQDPERLLHWSERWRATALGVPPLSPAADAELTRELSALRTVTRQLEGGSTSGTLLTERRRLEDAVRRRTLRTPARGPADRATMRLPELRRALRDPATVLLELADVDGHLHTVFVPAHGPLRSLAVGPTAAADRALAHALFALRREATGRGTHRLDLTELGARLEHALLGTAATLLGEGPVVLVPPCRLHAVPWGLMPALRERAFTVSPSAAAWLRARRSTEPETGRVVLVGGPGLSTGAREVHELAAQYPEAVVLADGEATCERVLAAMDGARLVHVAAHGTFRADSPLFSALQLDDGPLTVYDLERLARAPHRVVLSSCNSAVGAPSGADELLGVVSALVALGSAGVVASVVPVDDPSTVPFMAAFHRELAHCSPGEALARARTAAGEDPRARCTADSFLALGA